jgi:hypothetical protein
MGESGVLPAPWEKMGGGRTDGLPGEPPSPAGAGVAGGTGVKGDGVAGAIGGNGSGILDGPAADGFGAELPNSGD